MVQERTIGDFISMAKKIQIAFIGREASPVYYPISIYQPDKVVLFYSEETTDTADCIKELVPSQCEKRKLSPTNIGEITKNLIKCYEQYKDDEIIINISSGTKAWAYVAVQEKERLHNAQFIYVDQTNTIWNLTTGEQDTFEIADIDTELKLHMAKTKNYKNIGSYTEEDKIVLNRIKALRQFHISDFNKLTMEMSKYPNKTITETNSGSSLLWDKATKSFVICLRKNNGKCVEEKLQSPNIRNLLLNTGWLEYQIAEMISNWDFIKEVRLNCIFHSVENAAKNEIDIIASTGKRLLFVECKTKISEITAIDKFAKASKNFGGMGRIAIFITDEPLTNTELEKCKDNGILSFSFKNVCPGTDPEEELYNLLLQKLNRINSI